MTADKEHKEVWDEIYRLRAEVHRLKKELVQRDWVRNTPETRPPEREHVFAHSPHRVHRFEAWIVLDQWTDGYQCYPIDYVDFWMPIPATAGRD